MIYRQCRLLLRRRLNGDFAITELKPWFRAFFLFVFKKQNRKEYIKWMAQTKRVVRKSTFN